MLPVFNLQGREKEIQNGEVRRTGGSNAILEGYVLTACGNVAGEIPSVRDTGASVCKTPGLRDLSSRAPRVRGGQRRRI